VQQKIFFNFAHIRLLNKSKVNNAFSGRPGNFLNVKSVLPFCYPPFLGFGQKSYCDKPLLLCEASKTSRNGKGKKEKQNGGEEIMQKNI
jgi:hypothetical protein